MKKTIWGYDKKSADEYISTLEGQIDIMTSKLTALTMELNSANEELSYLRETSKSPRDYTDMHDKLSKRVQELEKENAALVEKYAQLRDDRNARITALMHENDTLAGQIANYKEQLQMQNSRPKYDLYNNDYMMSTTRDRALNEMDKIRKTTSDEIMNHIDTYIAAVEDANYQMKKIIGEVRSDYSAVADDLSKSMNKVFESLWVIDAYNERIEKDMIPTQKIALDLKKRVNELAEAASISGIRIPKFKYEEQSTTPTKDAREEFLSKLNFSRDDENRYSRQEKSAKRNDENRISEQRQYADLSPEQRSYSDLTYDTKSEISKDNSKHAEALKINTKIKPIDVFGKNIQ
ncbi:MAG: hypothetical protein A2Y17_03560 [Clostridiales bacterium GWF2_38_85]|nr:MAG: hypothetical protein A2Y17_03560 [Clostridiales bacterium GWF2_38_85]HBL85285.1 hypothetical protein [Clostridiales bacterium]